MHLPSLGDVTKLKLFFVMVQFASLVCFPWAILSLPENSFSLSSSPTARKNLLPPELVVLIFKSGDPEKGKHQVIQQEIMNYLDWGPAQY